MFKFILSTLLLFSFALPVQAESMKKIVIEQARGQDGGGGSTLALEFIEYGMKGLGIIARDLPRKTRRQYYDMEKVRNTDVFAGTPPCGEHAQTETEVCFDAYYFPEDNQIIFDQDVWQTKSCLQKLTIATHEYLRVLKLEGADYTYSKVFLQHDLISPKAATIAERFCRDKANPDAPKTDEEKFVDTIINLFF